MVRRRCVTTRRRRFWICVVVYECNITIRSVCGRDTEVRRLRGMLVVVDGVLE